MRGPELQDIEKVRRLLENLPAEDAGGRLAALLEGVAPRFYNDAVIVAGDRRLGRPGIYNKNDGGRSFAFREEDPQRRTYTGPRRFLDDLPAQLQWDAVCAVRNMLQLNCNEIPDL